MRSGRSDIGKSAIRKRSILLCKHRTSISLEDGFWEALHQIALLGDKKVQSLIAEIDAQRSGSLSSAVRLYVLAYYQARQPTQ